MIDATHTSGPWHVEPLQTTNGADIAICAPNNGYVVAVIQHDPDIQTSDNPDGESVKFHPSDIANAQLIAAAPDLLAALANLLALIELHIAERSKTPEEEDNFLSCHHITQARAAIAKTKA